MTTPGPFRAAPSPSTSLPVAPVVAPPTDAHTAAIEAAGQERAAANAALWQLQRHQETSPKRATARSWFVRNLASDYLPAIDALRAAGTPDELRAAQAAITARLEHGWGVPGARADDLWTRLLAQLEALGDALADNALASMLDRLDVWGGKGSGT